MLLFLDLSAALDTVNHQVFLSRLSDSFGIKGTALSWFESYLQGHTQFVCINNSRSSFCDMKVPLLDCFCTSCTLLHLVIYYKSMVYVFTWTLMTPSCTCHLSHLLLVILNAPVLFWSHLYVQLNVGCFIIILNSTATRLNYSFFTLSIDLLLLSILWI